MDMKMQHNRLNCQILASHIVDNMSMEDLKDYVFDDLYHLMLDDRELFESNLEFYKEEDEDGSND